MSKNRRRDLIMSETFTNQILGLSSGDWFLVMNKIRAVQDNPEVDNKTKKRLVNYKKPVYRVRAGDYRVLYSFGKGWVKLIGVDHRKDVYHKGHLIDVDLPDHLTDGSVEFGEQFEPEDVPVFLTSRLSSPNLIQESPSTLGPESIPESTPLSRPIDDELLRNLRVEDQILIAALRKCQTVEELIAAPISDRLRNSIFDIVTAKDYARVNEQNIRRAELEELSRFRAGTLTQLQIVLDSRQEKAVEKIITGRGPVILTGGPGTGKSTALIHAAAAFHRAFRNRTGNNPKILFTTYTNALADSSRDMLNHLLDGPGHDLAVITSTRVVRNIVSRCQPKVTIPDNFEDYLFAQALKQTKSSWTPTQYAEFERLVARLGQDYLVEEIENLIVNRNIRSLGEYRAESRVGRGTQLGRNQRELLWDIHEAMTHRVQQGHETTWPRLYNQAWRIASDQATFPKFDAVFVDEAQDLSLTALLLFRLMASSVSDDPAHFFIAADMNQTIYSLGRNWSTDEIDPLLASADHQYRFTVNYRSTRSIVRNALAYLKGGEVDTTSDELQHLRVGKRPVLASALDPQDEAEKVWQFIREKATEIGHGLEKCAILVPDRKAGEYLARYLSQKGHPARYMPSLEFRIDYPGVKITTLHGAKGLEFPVVAMALWGQQDLLSNSPVEKNQITKRLNHVGATRAMQALLITDREDRLSRWDAT